MLSVWPLALLIVTGEWLATRPAGSLLVRGWRLLAGIGLFSYSLYLLHVPLQSFVFHLMPQLAATWAKALLLAGWLGVVLTGSWLHYRWIEAPSIQWGRRVVARLRAAATPVATPVLPA
jgi:peptidoglycan/LPS O-acetylase OafA/YrhL